MASSTAWEAFNGGPDEEPTVRQIIRSDDGFEWPESELTNEIAGVQIHIYGDERPTRAFIKVTGRQKQRVQACWQHANALIAAGALATLFDEVSD